MIRQELNKRSPIRILENTTHGGLGKTNVGVFAARHGEGKTACLIHFALDALLQNKKVLHITFSENPDHIYSWYDSIFEEVKKAYNLEMAAEIHDDIARHRMILNFNMKRLSFDDMKLKIINLIRSLDFQPEVVIADGYDFENATAEDIALFKRLAGELNSELWLSFVIHRKNLKSANNPIPEPLSQYLSVLSVIILLESVGHNVHLRLLKDHERNCVEDTHLRLNPTTFLLLEE